MFIQSIMDIQNFFSLPMLPSPYDGRDHIYENKKNIRKFTSNSSSLKTIDLKTPLFPKTLDLRPFLNDPRNQGSRGTCCAFACSSIKEYQERLDVNYQGYFSPNSLYFYRQANSGMYCRNAMKILKEQGIATESQFPYTRKEPSETPEGLKENMLHYVVKEYARINTISGLKQALYQSGPCLIAFPVYNYKDQIWKPDDETQKSSGGHAMTVVGYNKNGFIIRNSWGSKWNKNGHAIYLYDDWGSHWEIWTCLDENSPPLPDKQWYQKSLCC